MSIISYYDLDNLPISPQISQDATHTSQKLTVSKNTVTGHKGYRQAKLTHGVSNGRWMFEVEIINLPLNSNARIGWAQISSDLQGPCGADKYSYALRLSPLTLFHDQRAVFTLNESAKKGDIISVMIDLQTLNDEQLRILNEYRWPGLPVAYCKFKRRLPLPSGPQNTSITYKINNKTIGSIKNVYLGKYYPSVSVFGNVTVKLNIGPHFAHKLPYTAMSLVG